MSILSVVNLNKSFGGLTAINDVSLDIEKETINAIIGPNGAGKTTFFNLISGRIKPDSGSIFFDGDNITNMLTEKIISKGIGRTFQITNIFPQLTAFENIQAALIKKYGLNYSFLRSRKKITKLADEAFSILKNIGLDHVAHTESNKLPYGDQRSLEIGIALANDPKLLLLDEPTAGMSPEDSMEVIKFINKIQAEENITILIIEHNMNIVFAVSQKIFVLHQGKLLSHGTPSQIQDDHEVITAYLGG